MATKNGLVLKKNSTGLLRAHILAHMYKIEKDLCQTNFTKTLVPHRSFSILYMCARICARRSPVDFYWEGEKRLLFKWPYIEEKKACVLSYHLCSRAHCANSLPRNSWIFFIASIATKNGLVLKKKYTWLLRAHIHAHMYKIEKDLCGTNFTKTLVPHSSFLILYMYSRIFARRSPVDF